MDVPTYLNLNHLFWQQSHQLLHLLHSVFGADEEGIGRIDDHEVLRPEEGDGTTSMGQSEGVSAFQREDVAAEGVSFFIG